MKALELVRAFSAMASGLFSRTPLPADQVAGSGPTEPRRKTWSLVQSYGNGTALWRCRQNDEERVMSVAKPDNSDKRKRYMDAKTEKHFFDSNNQAIRMSGL